jgi:NADP-dependent aldehyde dehydrogenase
VFTPSNFPLAFGVAGGDTAAALAAGCPVIVKGHPSHPQTSARCATAIHGAVAAVRAPAAAFTLIQSGEPEISRALVQAPEIAAVGFTGSQTVGRLLADLAAARPQPIPFYGELGSLNPVFLAPHALAARGDAIAEAFVASMTLGTGQFCTKPGVIVVPTGPDGDRFLSTVERLLATRDAGVMLNAGLQMSLDAKVDRTRRVSGVQEHASTAAVPQAGAFAAPRVFVVDDQTWRVRPELHDEHFGPVAIAIRTAEDRVASLAASFDGQLTATLQADDADASWASALVDVLATKAGRLVWNGFPTGVAVVPAMHHGGPYPSSTSSQHSSVGSTSIRRFLRPVAFQNVPDALLPPALQRANPRRLQRLIDGEWTRKAE